MRYVPNGLTVFRLFAAFAVFGLILAVEWKWATLLFILAILSDAFDGEIVRRFDLSPSPRGDMYDQVADGQLTLWVMLGLIITGHMPWLIGVVAVVGTLAVLLWVNNIPSTSPLWFVRRHQHYLHPFSYVALLYYALIILTELSLEGNMLGVAYGVYVVVGLALLFLKRERIATFVAGPVGV